MRKILLIVLSLILLTGVFSVACSSGSGGGGNTNAYRAAIERYFAAYLDTNVDTTLASLDTDSPMYPSEEEIESARSTEDVVIKGEITVNNMVVVTENPTKATVKADIYRHVDIGETGNWAEDTSKLIFDLTYKNGAWRIYDINEDTSS
jgi:hypothetical protein